MKKTFNHGSFLSFSPHFLHSVKQQPIRKTPTSNKTVKLGHRSVKFLLSRFFVFSIPLSPATLDSLSSPRFFFETAAAAAEAHAEASATLVSASSASLEAGETFF